MESLEVNQQTFDNIQGTNDLELIDNVTKQAGTSKKAKRKAKRKKILGGILAVATGGVSKLATKKGRKQIGKIAKKVGKVVAGSSILLPLVPLRPMMIKALNKQGVVATKRTSTADLANRFYKHVVRKQDSSYDELDINEVAPDNWIQAIGAVIAGIISFIKNLKKRKQQGETLSKTEELIVQGTEEAEAEIQESAKTEAAAEVGGALLFDRKTQLIILAVVVVVAWLIFRKR